MRILRLFTCFGFVLMLFGSAANSTAQSHLSAPLTQALCSKLEDFRDVRGQGPSCRLANGRWKVRLKNGTTIETHGPDSIAELASDTISIAAVSSSVHLCASTSDYYGQLIYAYPADKPDRYNTLLGTMRNDFQIAQDKLNSEALEFAVSAAYKMNCTPDGSVAILRVQLPTPSPNDSFSTIVSDLQNKGYSSTHIKYWIWYDDGISPGYCGQGGIVSDDRATADNGNNTGPSYGITYACSGTAWMHENGHNLGAVQLSSPESSGGWHCNDGSDVMCYSDGGSESNYRIVCSDHLHFDCNHNDFFNPKPAPGSYLATHWNMAACYVRFLHISTCYGPAIDAAVIRPLFNAAGTQTGMRQIFFAGNTFWQRDSTDAAGTAWPAAWISSSYQAAWGTNTNHPPTDRIDAMEIRPLYNTAGTRSGMRQIIFAGSTLWQRDSTDAAGTTWPAAWISSTYQAAWGSDLDHPPTDHIHAVVIRSLYTSAGVQYAMRQIFFAGEAFWQRDSTDAAGTTWPAAWTVTTDATAWGSNTNHPPITGQ